MRGKICIFYFGDEPHVKFYFPSDLEKKKVKHNIRKFSCTCQTSHKEFNIVAVDEHLSCKTMQFSY